MLYIETSKTGMEGEEEDGRGTGAVSLRARGEDRRDG
jgi:hypothetical protein